MAANKKISQFDPAPLGTGPDDNDFLGGYRDEGLAELNPNIRYNMAAYADWLLSQVSSGNAGKSIVSGGATYSGIDLDFIVSVVFNYFGNMGTASLDPASLNPGDATHPRFDLFAVEINAGIGSIVMIEGVPAADPVVPYPAENQIPIQPVLIAAGATVPAIVQTIVYANNAPGEWNLTTYNIGSGGAGTVDPESPDNPYEGPYCLAANVNTGRGLRLSAITPISLNEYPALAYFVRFPAPISSSRRLLSSVGFGGTGVGNVVDFMNFGLDRNSTDWQQIIVPTSLYNVIANDGKIDRIHLRMDANDTAITPFFLDFITFSTGIPTPPPATPGWSEVLAVNPNSGANSPRITPGQQIIFDGLIGFLIKFAGFDGLPKGLKNAAGNLIWQVDSMGMSEDGTYNTIQMDSAGRFRSRFFHQNNQFVIPYDSAVTWNWGSGGNNATITLTGDCVVSLVYLQCTTANLWVTQGGAGGHLIDFLGAVTWPDNTEPTWSTDPGKTDLISFISDGIKVIATAIIGYEL